MVGRRSATARDTRVEAAIEVLNRTDVAIVQHEYGLYDGVDGDDVVDVLDARRRCRSIVVAHTVLRDPTPHQRAVLEQVCAARRRGRRDDRDRPRPPGRRTSTSTPAKVSVIPHGAATPPASRRERPCDRPRASSAAAADLGTARAGQGHRVGDRRDGAARRPATRARRTWSPARRIRRCCERTARRTASMLVPTQLATRRGALACRSTTRYRDLAVADAADPLRRPRRPAVRLATTRSRPGVLVDAVAAGRPVVSTAFPHAVELLASGAGIVVPQRDPGRARRRRSDRS